MFITKIKIIFKIAYLAMIIYNNIYAECSDLDSLNCIQWPDYCYWDNEANICAEAGGGGSDADLGPYDFSVLEESDGIRNGPSYANGFLYYPLGSVYPLKSIIITPGWGGNSSSMIGWAEFFSSHGFIAFAIGPNDEINDSHEMRAEGLIDAIQTVKEEHFRAESPLFGMIDSTRFMVSGYSMGGGASQIALVLNHVYVQESIVGALALNPTIIFEDCNVCSDFQYCICLVPELLEHTIPTFIIAGQNEINELPSYDGLLGQDIYYNTPETTLKLLYEIENGGHGSAEISSGQVQQKVLEWVNYILLEDLSYCDSLTIESSNASQFLTTLDCETSLSTAYDVNSDGEVNNSDFIMLMVFVLNDENSLLTADVNSDLIIDVYDLLLLSDYLNER